MTKNEFIQKATVAGIEAGKHPSIAVRDAQFAAAELELNGQYFSVDFGYPVAPLYPSYPSAPLYPSYPVFPVTYTGSELIPT